MLRFPLFFVLFLKASSYQLVPSDTPGLGESRTAYDDFMDILRTSARCYMYFEQLCEGKHYGKVAKCAEEIRRDLFEQYVEFRTCELTEDTIRDIFKVYCQAKSYVPLALNIWIPPPFLEGSYTWDLNQESPYNRLYHMARQAENQYMEKFQQLKNEQLAQSEKKRDLDELEFFLRRLTTFCLWMMFGSYSVLVTVSIIKTIYFNHYFYIIQYEEGDDDEVDEIMRREHKINKWLYNISMIVFIIVFLAREYLKWNYALDIKYLL
ncbi:uncharacterized protein CELE_Y23H5B.12 [Caenorhabditis elegans]|uniref:Uncharacterized protein n=1 Tax=Caenorhabditis elegans TaxID=6239 RepID=A0A061ACI6_CAEEL|nr:Uncharacterized protein CELE_Y23H5B.12 [Caenorhabditis elegans]CDR32664.1 Uncharacterized protein CELE_Y23H5B.12 [Caenorhabditis elegans]|eukprot:NP_001293291.1 Uncharacterized protein CELE_Y23H5B.12 [Caenorhabditis elegans]